MIGAFATHLHNQFDAVRQLNADGQKSCEDLAKFLRERIALEQQYARSLEKLAVGGHEFGTLAEAFNCIAGDIVNKSVQHVEFANSLTTDILSTVDQLLAPNSDTEVLLAEARRVQKDLKYHEEKHSRALGKFRKLHQASQEAAEQAGLSMPGTASNGTPKEADDLTGKAASLLKMSFRAFTGTGSVEYLRRAAVEAASAAAAAKREASEEIRNYNECRREYHKVMSTVLQHLQELETRRRQEVQACLRRVLVFESSMLANEQYDVQQLAQILESVDDSLDLGEFIAQHSSDVYGRRTTAAAAAAAPPVGGAAAGAAGTPVAAAVAGIDGAVPPPPPLRAAGSIAAPAAGGAAAPGSPAQAPQPTPGFGTPATPQLLSPPEGAEPTTMTSSFVPSGEPALPVPIARQRSVNLTGLNAPDSERSTDIIEIVIEALFRGAGVSRRASVTPLLLVSVNIPRRANQAHTKLIRKMLDAGGAVPVHVLQDIKAELRDTPDAVARLLKSLETQKAMATWTLSSSGFQAVTSLVAVALDVCNKQADHASARALLALTRTFYISRTEFNSMHLGHMSSVSEVPQPQPLNLLASDATTGGTAVSAAAAGGAGAAAAGGADDTDGASHAGQSHGILADHRSRFGSEGSVLEQALAESEAETDDTKSDDGEPDIVGPTLERDLGWNADRVFMLQRLSRHPMWLNAAFWDSVFAAIVQPQLDVGIDTLPDDLVLFTTQQFKVVVATMVAVHVPVEQIQTYVHKYSTEAHLPAASLQSILEEIEQCTAEQTRRVGATGSTIFEGGTPRTPKPVTPRVLESAANPSEPVAPLALNAVEPADDVGAA